MTPPPTSIDGTDITGATIDGQEVQEITIDGQTVFELEQVPAEGDLKARYDFTQETGSTPVIDRSSNSFDLTGSFSGVSRSINGVQAGEFENDSLSVSFSESQPFCIATVSQPDAVDPTTNLYDGGARAESLLRYEPSRVQFFGFGLNLSANGISDTNPDIFLLNSDGSNLTLRHNGTQVASDSGASGSLTGFTLGASPTNDEFLDGLVGEVLIYGTDQSGNFANIETFLSNKFGIAI